MTFPRATKQCDSHNFDGINNMEFNTIGWAVLLNKAKL